MDNIEKRAEQQAKEEISNDQLRAQFAKSHAWKLVKQSLVSKIMELDSSSATVEKHKRKRKGVDEIMRILYTNGIAVGIVVDWINEVEALGGFIEADFAKEVADQKREQVIVTLPD